MAGALKGSTRVGNSRATRGARGAGHSKGASISDQIKLQLKASPPFCPPQDQDMPPPQSFFSPATPGHGFFPKSFLFLLFSVPFALKSTIFGIIKSALGNSSLKTYLKNFRRYFRPILANNPLG